MGWLNDSENVKKKIKIIKKKKKSKMLRGHGFKLGGQLLKISYPTSFLDTQI